MGKSQASQGARRVAKGRTTHLGPGLVRVLGLSRTSQHAEDVLYGCTRRGAREHAEEAEEAAKATGAAKAQAEEADSEGACDARPLQGGERSF